MNKPPITPNTMKNSLIRTTSRIVSAFLLASFYLATCAQATTIVKEDNADNLNLTTSWVGGVVPTSSDVAQWDSTVTAANATVLGADTNWAGITVISPGGTVTINAGNTLTLGSAGIDMSGASQNLTLNNRTLLGADQLWNVASGRSLTVVAGLGGSGLLTKSGAGTLYVSAVNTNSGGISVTGGTMQTSSSGNSTDSFGAGTVALSNGGRVRFQSTSSSTLNNALNIGSGGGILSYRGNSYYGSPPLSGSGTLTFQLDNNVTISPTSFQNWNGRIAVVTTGAGGTFRMDNSYATSSMLNAALDLGAGIGLSKRNATSGTTIIDIGTLTGAASSSMGWSGADGAGTFVYSVGARNEDATYAGTITQSGGARPKTGITKVGTGTWTLSGSSTYTGPTAVNAGKLVGVTGGCISNTVSFTVASGATNGIQVANTGGHWDTTNVTFSAGNTYLEFNYGTGTPSGLTGTSPNGAPLFIRGNLTANATVNVMIEGGSWAPGVYPLIKYTGTLSSFAAFNLLVQPLRVSGVLSNDTANSTIDYVVGAANQPLNWAAGSGTWDIATSPNWKDAAGTSTTYQELAGMGDQVVFEDTLSGASPITVTLNSTVVPVSVVVNASKGYTISGSGGISGITGLTKSGSGALTLRTANAFTGAVGLNGGIVNFAAAANLGASTAPLNFAGGTLQYALGNLEDVSVHTITLGGGGGTIDDGGNAIAFANPIGNSGVGGFTKVGAGTLTLNGTNRYSGNTLVSQGTLALGANAAIPNSPSITVNSSAVLDVSASGLVLNGTASQVLAGSGTVNGSVTCGTSTSITPGTSAGMLTMGDLTFNGGTYVFDVSTTSRDLIVAANLNLVSGTIQVVASGALTNGVYRLVQYSGGLLSGPGSAANLVVSGFSQPGKVAALTDFIAGEIDLVISTQGGDSIVWQGDGANNFWDIETTANWTNSSGAAVQFVQADKVTFDDTSPNTSVNLQSGGILGAIQPGAVTVNGTQSYTFQTAGNGKITGSTGLTNNSPGTLTILTANNNTGPTVINAGTVQVGNGGTTGDLGSGNVINNSALIFAQTDDRSVAGQISGAGSLTQQGLATLSLAQDNTLMSGPITINSGTLQVGNGGATGGLGTSAVTDNATLSFNRSGAFTFGNTLSGSGALVMNGPGTMTLSGAYTYLGNTYINNGVVKLGAYRQIPDGDFVLGSTGWLILDGGATSAGVLDLNGFNQTVNALSGLGGTVVGVISNSAASGTNILTVGTAAVGANTTFNGRIVDNAIGATNALVVRGATTLRLNGNNTYSGGTFVGDTATLVFGPGATIGNGGSITLSNGTTFRMMNAGSTSSFPGNNLILPTGATATLSSSQQGNGYGGQVYGDAISTNVIANDVSCSVNNVKQYQNFPGTVQIPSGASLRFSSTSLTVNGGDSTTFEVEGQLDTRNGTASGAGVALGALVGTAGILTGAINADGNSLYVIGAKNIDCTFSGTVSGATPRGTSITKVGTSRLTLDGTLSYDRTTTVSNGVLAIASANNPATSLDSSPTINVRAGGVLDVSARSDSTLTLGNATSQVLSGSGTIWGSLVEGANSTINPGDGIGILTVANTATLGGLVSMELNRTNTPNADRLVAASIAYGGTLTVTNLGPMLMGGDTFQLFSGALSGAFAATNLPALAPGLSWDASQLNISGQLRVSGQIIPPQIGALLIEGTTNVLNGTGGMPGAAYSVLTSTNVALPLASWTVLGNGTFATDGSWIYTNRFATNALQFYTVWE
jgi:fibronectin-binding autotransporter adhesin